MRNKDQCHGRSGRASPALPFLYKFLLYLTSFSDRS
nr:MAG TPA: hypothetical protein [Inoviridae sp.]